MKTENPVLLVILDGFGEGEDTPGNAILRANMKFYKGLREKYPMTFLNCSGNAVGLPKETQGGSEVGHFTMGSGRITWQSLATIDRSIKEEKLFRMKPLVEAYKKPVVHLLGMISDQGVHSDIQHLFALLEMAKKKKAEEVYIHAILDGRDVGEKTAPQFIKQIQKKIHELGLQKVAKIATIVGRYYAMDRDTNWDRTEKAYNLFTQGEGKHETDPQTAIRNAYKNGVESDYYVEPIVISKKGIIQKSHGVVFWNFRSDRARQLTWALTGEKPPKDSGITKLGFKPKKKVNPYMVCFGPYSEKAPVLFPTPEIKKNLGEILSQNDLKQLRVAETEKYAHVTFFFNSQIEKPFKGEDRIMVPSPKCPSYADKPEMSAKKVTIEVNKALRKKDHDVIIVNFANGDLVGHSGDLKAAIQCCKVLDECLSKVIPQALKSGYTTLLTADHGNADEMKYENGDDKPAHTLNPVHFLLISDSEKAYKLKKNRGLQDIAPTILNLLDIKKPAVMTGETLIRK